MSLSDTTCIDAEQGNRSLDGKITGRVIVGMDSPGPDEMSVQDIEGKKKLVWDDSVDSEYMDRVRSKAQAMAKDILAKAMREAEEMKQNARHEGYEEGIAQAQAELDQHVAGISQSMEGVLASVSAQGAEVWNARRQDIVTLIRMTVDKVLHVELNDRREEVLENLLDQAIERIETQRTLTLRVSPQDRELMDALLPQVQERNPAVKQWKLKTDPAIEMGGAIIETNEGKVENTVDARWKTVEPILDEMTVLPLDEKDRQSGSDPAADDDTAHNAAAHDGD
jgi:flagellar assembly protein FliH